MRSAARLFLAVMLGAVLLAAAMQTLRGLRHVDPRGRASWAAAPVAFDDTPRELTVFLAACDVRAIVLHPTPNASGRLAIDYFRLEIDRRSGVIERSGAGGATVLVAGPSPVVLPMRAVEPGWREALTLRVRLVDHVGQPVPGRPPITLDPVTPVTLDAFDDGLLGRFACAFDAGNRPGAWTVVTAMFVLLASAGMLGAAWIARAALRPMSRGRADVITGAALDPTGTSTRRTGLATAAALLPVAATTIAHALVVPPFEPPDELAHLQYARFVATTGTLPRAVPGATSEWRASAYEWVQQPLYYLAAGGLLKAASLDSPGPVLEPNPRSRLQPGGTEPTIYRHAAPPHPAAGHRALRLLRVASLLMALATTWVMARLLTTVTNDGLVIATVAGGLGLIPQWCAVMGAVSTDPPATLLASAATLAIVRVGCGRRGTGWLVLTGVLIGAAYAVKATAGFLGPMTLLACVLGTTVDRRWRPAAGDASPGAVQAVLLSAVRAAIVIGAGIVMAAAWIHVRAWFVFGDPLARDFKRAVLEAGGFVPARGPMPWTPEFWTQMRVMVFEPFWARFGSLGAGPFAGSRVWLAYAGASVLLVVLALLAAIGTSIAELRRIRRSSRSASTPPGVNVCALSICGVGVGIGLAAWIGVNLFPRADMVVHWTPRHILPLTAPAAVLVGAGLEHLRHAPPVVYRVGVAATGLTLVALGLAWLGVLRATVLMFHFGY